MEGLHCRLCRCAHSRGEAVEEELSSARCVESGEDEGPLVFVDLVAPPRLLALKMALVQKSLKKEEKITDPSPCRT